MATNAVVQEDLPECPVCSEDYKEPKILPCAHIVCKQCILTWLKKEGRQAGCPLCRRKILPNQGQGQVQGDLAAAVDALPTDFALVALVNGSSVLKGRRTCALCEGDDVEATSYCVQCDAKLCDACRKTHKKFPTLRDHEVQHLEDLTAKKIADSRRSMCKVHPDLTVELFCPKHQELLCFRCATTTHEACLEKKTVSDAAQMHRQALMQHVNDMKLKEKHLDSQIHQSKEKFKATYLKVKDTFDDLQQTLEKRRQTLNAEVKAAEDDAKATYLAQLEEHRAAVVSLAGSVQRYVDSSPDDALLCMSHDLKSRIDILRADPKNIVTVPDDCKVIFGASDAQLKKAIYNMGIIQGRTMMTANGIDQCILCGYNKFQIFIQRKSNPQVITVHMNVTGQVIKLKQKIQAKENIPAEKQILKLVSGKTLSDNCTLSDYNIQRNDTLLLTETPPADPQGETKPV